MAAQHCLPSLESVEIFLNSGMLDPFICNFLLGSTSSAVRESCSQCLLVQWACILDTVLHDSPEEDNERAKKMALQLFNSLTKWLSQAPRYGRQVRLISDPFKIFFFYE